MGWDNYATAAAARDIIADIAAKTVERLRPEPKIGQVVSIDLNSMFAECLFAGEAETVRARFYKYNQPSVDDFVRVFGKAGSRWISDVITQTGLYSRSSDGSGQWGQIAVAADGSTSLGAISVDTVGTVSQEQFDISFSTNWTHYEGAYAYVKGFYTPATNMVHLEGLAKRINTTTDTLSTHTIANIPADYRPSLDHIFTVWASSSVGSDAHRFTVNSAGDIVIRVGSNFSFAPNGYVSFGGINYYLE